MDATIIVRVDPALKNKLNKAAKKDGRTLSNYIRLVLEKSLQGT